MKYLNKLIIAILLASVSVTAQVNTQDGFMLTKERIVELKIKSETQWKINLKNSSELKNKTFYKEYDANGLLVKSTTFGENDSVISENKLYYDSKSLLRQTDSYRKGKNGRLRNLYSYDTNDKLSKSETYDESNKLIVTMFHSYNPNGKLIQLETVAADNKVHLVFKYLYDDKDNMIELQTEDINNKIKSRCKYTYDDKNNMNSQTTYDNKDKMIQSVEKKYDEKGILIGEIAKNADLKVVSEEKYVVDNQGRYLEKVISNPAANLSKRITSNYDEKGIIWKDPLSPFDIHLIALNMKNSLVKETSEKLYRDLQKEGFEVLFDDRIEGSAGIKFNDADLLGMPVQIIVGEKNLKENKVELHLSDVELKKIHTIRIAIQKSGNATNIQSIFLKNGKIANNNNFLWNDAIIYSLMIDRFKDGDKNINNPVQHDSLLEKANYMGGDFQGIIDKLNEGYFEKLGINTLWISPVYDNPNEAFREYPAPHRYYSGYHGYWPISPYNVEEKFGSMDKLKELISIAHKQNIKVLLDFVSNHVHEQHPYFKEHRDWFGDLELPDGRLNLRFWDEFRLTTWFEPYLPSFDYLASTDALEAMTDNAVWWLKETGADGFRHDAVKHVPNEFWRLLTQKLKKEVEAFRDVPVYQIGETFGSYDLISSYVNNGQLSSQFNFNLYDVAIPTFTNPSSSFSGLDKEMHKTFSVYGGLHLMGNIMDSHDKNRFMAFADGDLDVSEWSAVEQGWNNPPVVDKESSYKKAELYYAYMNSIPGLPVIYYGSEFGMSGASDPDNRRMMRFDDQLNENEKLMLSEVQKIINIRKEHPALRYGDFYTLQADENIYSFIRSDFNERIVIVLNKNENSNSVKLQIPNSIIAASLKDIISGEEINLENGSANINVDGIGWRMFVVK